MKKGIIVVLVLFFFFIFKGITFYASEESLTLYEGRIIDESRSLSDYSNIKLKVNQKNFESEKYSVSSYQCIDVISVDYNGYYSYYCEDYKDIIFEFDLNTLPERYGLIKNNDDKSQNFYINKIEKISFVDNQIKIISCDNELMDAPYYSTKESSDDIDIITYNVNGVIKVFNVSNNTDSSDIDNNNHNERLNINDRSDTLLYYESVNRIYSTIVDNDPETISIVENYSFYYLDNNNLNYVSDYIDNTEDMIDNVFDMFIDMLPEIFPVNFPGNAITDLLEETVTINISVKTSINPYIENGTAYSNSYVVDVYLYETMDNYYNYSIIAHELSHLVVDNSFSNTTTTSYFFEAVTSFFEIYSIEFYSNRINLNINNGYQEWLGRHDELYKDYIKVGVNYMQNTPSFVYKNMIDFYFFNGSDHSNLNYYCVYPILILYRLYSCQNNFLTILLDYADYFSNYLYLDFTSYYGNFNLNNPDYNYSARYNCFILQLLDYLSISLNDYYDYLCSIISLQVSSNSFEYGLMNRYYASLDATNLFLENLYNSNETFLNKNFKSDTCMFFWFYSSTNIRRFNFSFSDEVLVSLYDDDHNLISSFHTNSLRIIDRDSIENYHILIYNDSGDNVTTSLDITILASLNIDNLVCSSFTAYDYTSDYSGLVSFTLKSNNNQYYLKNYLSVYDTTSHSSLTSINNSSASAYMNNAFNNETVIYKLEEDHNYIIVANLDYYFENNIFSSANLILTKAYNSNLSNIKNYKIYEESSNALKNINAFEYTSYGEFYVTFGAVSSITTNINVLVIKESNGSLTVSNYLITPQSRSIISSQNILYGDKVYIIIDNINVGSNLIYETIQDYDYNEMKTLIPDKNGALVVGSEVNVLGHLRESSEMTVGFTRCMYIDATGLFAVRQSYYWYSSNESVAEVSIYGTVFAKSAGTCFICCVYKNDMSIIGIIEIRATNDTITTPVSLQFGMDIRTVGPASGTQVTVLNGNTYQVGYHNSYIDLAVGYTRFICLGSDAPTDILQNYWWYSSDDDVATVSIYGTILGISESNVTITGIYKYDTRFTVTINISVYDII